MEVAKTDIKTAVRYLEDARKLYDALAAIPMQKCSCRSYMINQLTTKLKKLIENDKS